MRGPHNPGSHGARGPVKPFKFEQPLKAEQPYPLSIDDDSSQDWWGGVQKCFASVALASVVAAPVAALSPNTTWAQQDDLPLLSVDEDYVQLPFPAQPPQPPQVFRDDDQIVPQAVAFCPDEDVWVSFSLPPTPTPANITLPQWSGEQHEPAGSLYGQPDEDYWQNPSAPVPVTYGRVYLPDPEELPTGSLHGAYEDDSWLNGPPFSASFVEYLSLPLGDPEELPAGSLHGIYEDDSWLTRPPFPAPFLEYLSLPLGDPEELPAGSLHGAYEDDFYSPPLPVQLGNWARVLGDDDQIVPQPITFEPDEDYWLVLPQSQLLSNFKLSWDPEELPAGNLHGAYEDDSWLNAPPFSSPALHFVRLPLGDPEEIPAGSLHSPEEDYWINWAQPQPFLLYQKLPLGDPEEIPAGSLHQLDEDYWLSPITQPSLASFVHIGGEQDDLPSALTALRVDEDYWLWTPLQLSFSPPVRAFTDDEVIVSVAAPFGLDEDYWRNFAQPILPTVAMGVRAWEWDGDASSFPTPPTPPVPPIIPAVWLECPVSTSLEASTFGVTSSVQSQVGQVSVGMPMQNSNVVATLETPLLTIGDTLKTTVPAPATSLQVEAFAITFTLEASLGNVTLTLD